MLKNIYLYFQQSNFIKIGNGKLKTHSTILMSTTYTLKISMTVKKLLKV